MKKIKYCILYFIVCLLLNSFVYASYSYTTILGQDNITLVSLKRSDGLIIPLDPKNIDYQEYLAWVKQGNTPSNPIPVSLEQTKQNAANQLLTNMNTFVSKEPDGTVRYDINFQISALQYAIAHSLTTPPLPALNAWRQAVATEYFTVLQNINLATTIDAVQMIDISVNNFETKFGVSGSISADPNITTQQLMQ